MGLKGDEKCTVITCMEMEKGGDQKDKVILIGRKFKPTKISKFPEVDRTSGEILMHKTTYLRNYKGYEVQTVAAGSISKALSQFTI